MYSVQICRWEVKHNLLSLGTNSVEMLRSKTDAAGIHVPMKNVLSFAVTITYRTGGTSHANFTPWMPDRVVQREVSNYTFRQPVSFILFASYTLSKYCSPVFTCPTVLVVYSRW